MLDFRIKGEYRVAVPSDGTCAGCGKPLYVGYVFTLERTGEEFCERDCAYYVAKSYHLEDLRKQQAESSNQVCAEALRKFRHSPCPCGNWKGKAKTYLECCGSKHKEAADA